MSPGSIENWFALPPPRAASYLPAPYGARHGVTARFASSSPESVYLPNHRLVVASDTCAADFGHDNLAWSRKPPPRGRARLMLAAIGGAVLGAALMALLGAMMAGRAAEQSHSARGSLPTGKRAPASVVASAAEVVPSPTQVLDSVPALAAPSAPAASRAGALPQPMRGANGHAVPALRPTPPRRSDSASVRVREPEVVQPVSGKAAFRRAPTKPRPAAPADSSVSRAPGRCGDDWPCGDALRALQGELKQWEARKHLPAARESHVAGQTSVHLTDHRRVTEW